LVKRTWQLLLVTLFLERIISHISSSYINLWCMGSSITTV